MDQFAEDEVEYATINRSHNTLSTAVVTELKNKFQYEIQDSSSDDNESETETESDSNDESSDDSTVESASTIDGDDKSISSSDNNEKAETASIGSAASLLDFGDAKQQSQIQAALTNNQQPDTVSICSTDVADLVQRQLAEFSNTLRRQIESDMESIISKKMGSTLSRAHSEIIPPATPTRKKHNRTRSMNRSMNNGTSTRRKVRGPVYSTSSLPRFFN